MRNNTGSSYSDRIKSSTDRKLLLKQENKSHGCDPKVQELLDTVFSLSPFVSGLCWGGIFALTSVVSATLGAKLTHFQTVSKTVTNLLVKYNFPNSSVSSTSTESSAIPSLSRSIDLLIVGSNSRDNSLSEINSNSLNNTISVLLFRFQPQDNFVSITTIPGDSQVEIPGLGFGTIQEAHSYGGIEMVSQVVSKTLDDVEIDRYIKANPTTLLKLIDLLGGLEVFVPQESIDNQGKPTINSTSGWHTLEGKQVVELILQNNENDKIDKIQQQQILLEAIRQQLHNPSFADKVTQTVQTLQHYLDTDLSFSEMESLLSFFHQLETDEITVNLLPNYDNHSQSAQDNFIIPSMERYLGEVEAQSDRTSSNKYYSYSGNFWRNVPIVIQNTTNNPELSLRVLEYLIGQGFYNVYLNKYIPLHLSQTEIIAQSKDQNAANYLQKVLNIGKLELSGVKNDDSELTIRLGEDAKFIFLDGDFIR